jgi:hypothetical protein
MRQGEWKKKKKSVARRTLSTVLLYLALVDRRGLGALLHLGGVEVDVSGVPNEGLDELVVILLLDDDPGCFYDVTDVVDELLTIGGELGGIDGRMGEDVFESGVDLGVGRHLALAKGGYDAVEFDLNEMK